MIGREKLELFFFQEENILLLSQKQMATDNFGSNE